MGSNADRTRLYSFESPHFYSVTQHRNCFRRNTTCLREHVLPLAEGTKKNLAQQLLGVVDLCKNLSFPRELRV